MSEKKKSQLGMSPSTAAGHLIRDILYSLIVETGKDSCFQCGNHILRKELSIEHKIPWLDSDDPVGNYFNLDNISFSHNICNIKAARKRPESKCPSLASYNKGCRCHPCVLKKSKQYAKGYTPESRKERYKRTGS